MKTRRAIYIVLGFIFILLDILTTLVSRNDFRNRLNGDSYNLGYLLGSQVFLYIGIVFLYAAHRVKKKMKAKKQSELDDAINRIGHS